MSYYGEAYSPGTAGDAAASQMIVVRRQELQSEISNWEARKRAEQQALAMRQQQIDQQRQVVLQREATSWAEENRVQSQRRDLEHDRAVVQQERTQLAVRVQEVERLEDLRRRNRTVSEAYIEDSFAGLSPQAVVQNLTHASIRVKEHAKKNISNAISGSTHVEHFVQLDPKSIAPFILPKLQQLVATRGKPILADIEFAENVVSSPAMAKALSLGGHCGRLADFLVQQDHAVSRLAICGFRQMTKMETSVVVPAYTAIATTLPQLPMPNPFSGEAHPSVGFVVEVAPKIVDDCFNNQRWNTIGPLATHKIESIRRVALQTVLFQAQSNENVREGLVKSRTLELLDHYFQLSTPPVDIVDLFIGILPLLADRICQDADLVLWLLRRLNDPSLQIQLPAIEAIRTCAMKDDATIQHVFVQVELLKRLNDPATNPSIPITKLICTLLPTLAVSHARSARSFLITTFLEHPESSVSTACLVACRRILESSPEHRADLLSAFLKLDLNRESTLRLADVALPIFCGDWVSQGSFAKIAKYIESREPRVRYPAQKAWLDAVSSSPTNCERIAKGGLLEIMFAMCNSSHEDSIVTGWQVLPYMATEVSRAGVGPTRDLVNLIHHPRVEMRRAVLQSLQIIAEGGINNCEQLLSADAFSALSVSTKKYPQDGPEFFEKILVCMSPSLSKDQEACSSLLQLLDSDLPRVAAAASNSLATMASYSSQQRQNLRRAILEHLPVASDTVVLFTVKAIPEWLGTDLAQSGDFQTLFELASHSNRLIQNASLLSLKQKFGNQSYQDALEQAQVASFFRSLCSSANPDAIAFVGAGLPVVALTLARNQHADVLIQLLALDIPVIREGSSSAIQVIAASTSDRELLLNEDILERLIVGDSSLDHVTLKLARALIPNLAIEYVRLDRIDVLLALIDHHEQSIREAVATAVVTLSKSPKPHNVTLRDALLTRLNGASSTFIDVVSRCLSRAIAHDLAKEKKYDTLFMLLQHEDFRIRSPVAAELRVFIQKSDEPTRMSLVAAGLLKAALSRESYDDLVQLLEECVLPLLGPAFSQSDGGQCIVPLLTHNDIRLRTAALACLRNAVDSPHGSLENITKSGIVTDIHTKIRERESIRDLWCYILPKAAPFLSVRAEIDLVFDCLSDQTESIREACKEAISAMARTSSSTRQYLYPTIINRLDEVSDFNIDSLSLAVSLSGSDFLSNGHEFKLVSTIRHDNLALATSAVDATIDLISRGGSSAHQKLMEADVFAAALQLRLNPARDKASVKLLLSILDQLSGDILLGGQRSVSLVLLFDDPNPDLSQALYTSLSADTKLVMAPNFPELLPSLLSDVGIGNQFVSKLLVALSESIIPRLLTLKRVDLIVKTLTAKDNAVTGKFFAVVHAAALNAADDIRNELATDSSFVSVLGRHLKSQDSAMRRLASEVIDVLSKRSSGRSEKMMQAGIGESLAWVAVHGEHSSHRSAIMALSTLFLAAPDHADRLVADSLPALCHILEDLNRTIYVYEAALRFLSEVVHRFPHLVIIESGIMQHVTPWINPQFSMSSQECRQLAYDILLVISQNSDAGRQSVIEAGILPILTRLATGQKVENIINACNLVTALVHTGTFRQAVVDVGMKKVMEDITSWFHKSTLANKADKKLARDHAKEVLLALKATKNVPSLAASTSVRSVLQRSSVPTRTMSLHRPSGGRSYSEGVPPTGFGGSVDENGYDRGSHRLSGHVRSVTEPSDAMMPWSPHGLSTVHESAQPGSDLTRVKSG
ncbi:hypothetical protein GALMADRAFT_140093 [Galerina marginata CBS 339.88]|uniref:Uncharacterized protein n=1 Tax=Galerina marginata (strain CBS 339.88) TaxID=685588 RepID=A0A067T253_GALM3|nr:hypothetical protein GALMADRAFT_140093 [Galerina marginata CBS 339.88]